MAKKTAAQKLEALLERATELLEDVEVDAKLKHETGLGRSLADMADRSIYTDEEIGQMLVDYDIDIEDQRGVRAGIRLAAKMIGNHDLDTDTDDDAEVDASAPVEAQPESADDDTDGCEP